MVQSPSWEANWFAASQEIPHIFMEPEGSLPHSQASATCPYPVPAQSSPHTHIPFFFLNKWGREMATNKQWAGKQAHVSISKVCELS